MYLDELILKAKAETIKIDDIINLLDNYSFEIYNSGYLNKLIEFFGILKNNNYYSFLNIIFNAIADTKLFHLMILKYVYSDNFHEEQYFKKIENAIVDVIDFKSFNALLNLLTEKEKLSFINSYITLLEYPNIDYNNMNLNYLMPKYDELDNKNKQIFHKALNNNIERDSNYKLQLNHFNKKYYDIFKDNLDNITFKNISYSVILDILNDTMQKAEAVAIGKNNQKFDFSDQSLNIIYNYLKTISSNYVTDSVKFFIDESLNNSIKDTTKKEMIITEENLPYIDNIINNSSKTKCLLGYKIAIKYFKNLKTIVNKDRIEIDFFGVKPNMPLKEFINYYQNLANYIDNYFFTELEKYIYIYSKVKDMDNKLLEMNILLNLCNIPSDMIVIYDKNNCTYVGYNLAHIKDYKYQINELYVSLPSLEDNINQDFSTYKYAFYPYDCVADIIENQINKHNFLKDSTEKDLSLKTLHNAFNYVSQTLNPDMTKEYANSLVDLIFYNSGIAIPIDGNITLEKSLNYGKNIFDNLFEYSDLLTFTLKNFNLNNKTNEVEFKYSLECIDLPNEYLIEAINDLFITDKCFFPNYNIKKDFIEITFYFNKNVALKDFIVYINNRLSQIYSSLLKRGYLVIEEPVRERKKDN